MITYQKVYTDHVHSSTLMSQFTQLWKNHLMCDAEIIIGSTVVKAHRLVLVASCAILQSYDNTATGSVLEVTLPNDVQPQSVNTFLEFLYQGHMILTEDNVQSIERIARLLHVDDILKCCQDFTKTLKFGIGEEHHQFNFQNLVEVDHIRSTSFIKSLSDLNCNRSSKISVENKLEGQRSSYMDSSDSVENSSPMKAASSVSFVTSPCVMQRQRFRLGDIQNETHSRPATNSFTSVDHMAEKEKLTQHSIIDLSNERHIESRPEISNQFSIQQQNIDPKRSCLTTIENSGSNLSSSSGTNLNSKRRHSDQNMPSSFEPSTTNNAVYSSASRSQNNYYRSLSDENLNHDSIRNTPAVSYAAQYGFAMPVLPSPLWTEKALLQQFSSHNQNPRCSSTNSVTSSCSSKASANQQVTRGGSEFSDLPICIEQDDSDDNRLVLDVSDIDLSLIKTENVEEPLDLHVEGVPVNFETMGRIEKRPSDQTNVNIKTEYQKPVHSGHFPGTPVYNTTYQQSVGSDISKQWSSQLQMAMVKKRPTSISTNVRKIIQDLNLNRRALASPAALGSLAVGNHKPVRMPGKNNYKVCSLCYRNKIRTKSGYYVYSYYKCSVCDVPLCIGRRKCFLEYHKEAESKQND